MIFGGLTKEKIAMQYIIQDNCAKYIRLQFISFIVMTNLMLDKNSQSKIKPIGYCIIRQTLSD